MEKYKSIKMLKLDENTKRALSRAGKESIEDIMNLSIDELTQIRNIGYRRAHDIRELLDNEII